MLKILALHCILFLPIIYQNVQTKGNMRSLPGHLVHNLEQAELDCVHFCAYQRARVDKI